MDFLTYFHTSASKTQQKLIHTDKYVSLIKKNVKSDVFQLFSLSSDGEKNEKMKKVNFKFLINTETQKYQHQEQFC